MSCTLISVLPLVTKPLGVLYPVCVKNAAPIYNFYGKKLDYGFAGKPNALFTSVLPNPGKSGTVPHLLTGTNRHGARVASLKTYRKVLFVCLFLI